MAAVSLVEPVQRRSEVSVEGVDLAPALQRQGTDRQGNGDMINAVTDLAIGRITPLPDYFQDSEKMYIIFGTCVMVTCCVTCHMVLNRVVILLYYDFGFSVFYPPV
ncbi:Glycerol-3-phosphate dehydrogenase [Trichinella pseudospiralis]